eukprot:265589-Pelagomonas_calceolata.AAC.1
MPKLDATLTDTPQYLVEEKGLVWHGTPEVTKETVKSALLFDMHSGGMLERSTSWLVGRKTLHRGRELDTQARWRRLSSAATLRIGWFQWKMIYLADLTNLRMFGCSGMPGGQIPGDLVLAGNLHHFWSHTLGNLCTSEVCRVDHQAKGPA